MDPEQSKAALAKANRVRSGKVRIKVDLKAKRISIKDLLHDPPDILDNARLYEFLVAVPNKGRARALDVLKRIGATESVTIGSLTDRQRDKLMEIL